MAITSGYTKSFISELLQKEHDLVDDTLKMALYSSGASLGEDTTAYTTDGEISGGSYTAGGKTLTTTFDDDQKPVFMDFDDLVWTGLTESDVAGALIYNASNGNKSIAVISFQGSNAVENGNLTITFPAANINQAIIRAGD